MGRHDCTTHDKAPPQHCWQSTPRMSFLKQLHRIVFDNSLKRAIHDPNSPLRQRLLIKSQGARMAVNSIYFCGTVAVGYVVMNATTRTPEDLGLADANGQPIDKATRARVAMFSERNGRLQVELDHA